MPVQIDITNQKFGRLLVISRAVPNKHRGAMWRCRCECGREKVIAGNCLKSGRTVSCGCYQVESRTLRATVHGEAAVQRRTPEYSAWIGMKTRCYNPKTIGWNDYGGRGIKVCDRWRESFECFLADMGRKPTRSHSMERMDNQGDYEPSNCRWATSQEQMANRRKLRRPKNVGSKRYGARLSEVDVIQIRARYSAGTKGRTLASEFQVSPATISAVCSRAAWTHI